MREDFSTQVSALQYKALSIALDVAALSFRNALAAKFSPDQPRDRNGRWANREVAELHRTGCRLNKLITAEFSKIRRACFQ